MIAFCKPYTPLVRVLVYAVLPALYACVSAYVRWCTYTDSSKGKVNTMLLDLEANASSQTWTVTVALK